MNQNNQETVAVQYIGRREQWIERRYKSGLTFTKGQVRSLPSALARNLLRHIDLFAVAKEEAEDAEQANTSEPAAPEPTTTDDTAAQLEKAQKEAAERQAVEENRQGVIDQVMIMDKDALAEFAHTNYQQTISKRKSVENLRTEVAGFVDQFGVV